MKVILAKPRGFCAGVERAIKCVETALDRYGPPVYVLNDIVHNALVVNDLRAKGAVFVKDLSEVPPNAHLLFSAHGVGPDKWREAEARHLHVVDATCPLVEKVHNEARRFSAKGYVIVLIGDAGHDEVRGTMGWAPGNIRVLFAEEEIDDLDVPDGAPVTYITQTTLSLGDCQRVVEALKRRFPTIEAPCAADICYATQNRQKTVNTLAPDVDLVLVVGDRESANSNRLAGICRALGKPSHLISSAAAIDDAWLEGVDRVLVTAGASAPESLVQGVIEYLRAGWSCEVVEEEVVPENVHFQLPPTLA